MIKVIYTLNGVKLNETMTQRHKGIKKALREKHNKGVISIIDIITL